MKNIWVLLIVAMTISVYLAGVPNNTVSIGYSGYNEIIKDNVTGSINLTEKSLYWKGSQIGFSDARSSIALDVDDNPHIAYIYADRVYYTKNINSCCDASEVDKGGIYEKVSLSIYYPDTPHIAYIKNISYDYSILNYSVLNGNTWEPETVDGQVSASADVCIKLDMEHRPHIAYGGNGGKLKYASLVGGSWDIEEIDDEDRIYSVSLDIDSFDRPHISYYASSSSWSGLKYAYWNGTAWNIEEVDPYGTGNTSIAADSKGHPHISYKCGSSGLRYAYWNGTGWEIYTIDAEENVGDSSSIDVDKNDDPHIVYYEPDGDREVRYVWRDNDTWYIDRAKATLGKSVMALDSEGYPWMDYAINSFEGVPDLIVGYVDHFSPKVYSVDPVNGEIVNSSSKIKITFDDQMNRTMTGSAFSIYPPVNGSFSWSTDFVNGEDVDVLTFTPDNLSALTTYRVTINASLARDAAGNLLDGNGDGVHNSADTWLTMADMPTPRQALTSSAVGDKIYAIGGDNGTRLHTVEIYDTINDSWTSGASMPTARSGMGSAALNGKIYVMGGGDESNVFSTLEIYDTASDSWSTGASMPTARKGLVAVALDGRIFAMGGRDSGGNTVGTVEIYDPANDTWSTGASMPTATAYACGAAVNGMIYVTGGTGGTVTQQHDPKSDSWTTKAHMPTDRTDLAGASVNGKFYAIGGSDSSNYAETAKNEEFDALRNTWSVKSDMPTARWDLSAAAVGGKIYVLGGGNSNGVSSKNEIYVPNDDYSWYFTTSYSGGHNETNETVSLPHVISVSPQDSEQVSDSTDITVTFSEPMNQSATESAFSIYPPVNGTFSWNANGDTLTFSPDAPFSSGAIYRVTIDGSVARNLTGTFLDGNGDGENNVPDTWTTLTSMPTAREALTASAVGNNIYAIGGSNGNRLSTVEIYDTVNDTWTTGSPMPTSRSGMGSAALNGKIYVMGGWDGSTPFDVLEVYDTGNDTWTTKSPMPVARRGLMAVALNGKIYAIGGYDSNNNATSTFMEYDPVNDTWTMKTPLKSVTAYGVASAINGRIYVTAGTVTQEYNPDNDTWTTKSSRSEWRLDMTGAPVNGKMYAIGGMDSSYKEVSTNEEFDALRDIWTSKSNMPTARYDPASAVVKGKIYVLGGGNSNGLSSKNEMYVPNDDYSWYFKVKSSGNGGDTTPPSFSGLQSITNIGDAKSLNLSWSPANDSSQPITYYIYRSTSPGAENFSNPIENTTNTYYTDTNLNEGSTYYYVVRAMDSVGNEDNNTVEKSAMPKIQWYFQIETPGIQGYQNLTDLSIDPLGSGYTIQSLEIDSAGQYWIGETSWLSERMGNDTNIKGNWTFNIYGHITKENVAHGHLYARVYRYINGSWYFLFQTSDDEENIGDFVEPHLFSWTYSAPSVNLGSWDRIYVDIWLNVSSVSGSSEKLYDYRNTTQNGTSDAYYCDVNIYPPEGENLNSKQELNDTEYSEISYSDDSWYHSPNPGLGDKVFMWFDTKIGENVSDITQMNFTFEGHPSKSSTLYIYLYNFSSSSWESNELAVKDFSTSDSILKGVLTHNFQNYVNSSGCVRWGVYSETSNTSLYVDYVSLDVFSKSYGRFVMNYDSPEYDSNVIPSLGYAGPLLNISVHSGWNLITIPWQTTPTSIDDALSGISWDRAMVYINNTWYTYDQARDAKYNLGFPMVDNTMGIWVNCTSDGTLSGPDENIGNTSIPLHKGWNLVGFPTDHDQKVSDALSGIPWEYLETSDASGKLYYLSSSDYMIVGKGYWIYVTADCVWTVEW